MIIYSDECFGVISLTRIHGSAVYKTLLPSLLSSALVFVIRHQGWHERELVNHPYSIGAFVGFFSFLLTFRLNYGYQRYWEGATAVHQMTSKWLDCAMCLASFHYQSETYTDIRPPTFGQTPIANEENVKGRDRKFYNSDSSGMSALELSMRSDLAASSSDTEEHQKAGLRRRKFQWRRKLLARDDSNTSLATVAQKLETREEIGKSINSKHPTAATQQERIPIPQRFQEQFTRKSRVSVNHSNVRRGLVRQRHEFDVLKKGRVPLPSLFLQELAHLLSLLSAVALSTLRNDIENAESPLTEYVPGKPWPPVDPDSLSKEIKEQYDEGSFFWSVLYFCLGLSRSSYRRTLYNAARPFTVLGSVSDGEIRLLQQARGPYAKVALCTMWVQEFMSREHLSGSTGNVAPPIISRLYQFLSDGVLGYNQARKVAYVDFPFVHAQATALFTMTVIFVFPFLYATKVNIAWFGALLDGVTVLCFLGLHEVARELENPFHNVPNDLPLTTFQAQFNEALVTMYAGFHPDSWWELKKPLKATSANATSVASSPFLVQQTFPDIPERILVSDRETDKDDMYLEITGGDRNGSRKGSVDSSGLRSIQ